MEKEMTVKGLIALLESMDGEFIVHVELPDYNGGDSDEG